MSIKDLRYNVMLALYFPILLYAFSTFDLSEETFVVEAFEPVVVGQSTVLLGQPFEARAFLAVASGEGQSLDADGSLQVIGDSLFRMSTAGLLSERDDEAIVPYAGSFGFRQLGGEIARIPISGSFRVRRPEIVAQSEAATALYRRSANQLRFEVPGLEDQALRIDVGGRMIDGRSVTLSPDGERASVRVFAAGVDGEPDTYLGTRSFAVIDPPRPELRVSSAGREVRSGDNIPRARAMLSFQVVADEQFRSRFPQDARYGVGRARVYLHQGLTASREVGVYPLDGGNLVLTQAIREARPGDRVTIVLEGVSRINHAGQAIPVPFQRGSLTFSFTLT